MQGQRSSVSTLPENLSFDHGSTSSDASIDSWNSMQTSAETRLPEFRIPSTEANNHHFHHRGHSEWCLGETSSSVARTQANHNERELENVWSLHPRANLDLEECPCPLESSDILSFDNVEVSGQGNRHTSNRPSLSVPRDLNICSDEEDDECQVIESPERNISLGPSNEKNPSFDGRRLSCKRKAQDDGEGSSSVGGDVSSNPLSETRTAESSRRNLRLRISGSCQQDHTPGIPLPELGNSDVSSSRDSSRLLLPNGLIDLSPTPPMENGSTFRRNLHSRWSGSSSPTIALERERERERDHMLYEESLSRSISEQPIFVPTSEMGGPSQQPRNAASTSWANSSSSSWSHQQYPRRLSEIVRRSLLSAAGTESGDQSSSGIQSNSLQETAVLLSTRSAILERHLAAASEGRSSSISEIRHVLDLMRRDEGLRFEDMMMLDHSVLFGMADLHDRHRDMRLDVDNMSYEELLALEDRIGDVCTGLDEETIASRLKQCKYGERRADEAETEPCSICREEYNDGEDLGTLECGHDFHNECIKKWLLIKNLCPICKTTGLPSST